MARFVLAVVALLAALVAGGCGDEADPRSGPEAEREIAETVTAMIEATRSGDGDSACALMTSRGQSLYVKVVRRELGVELESCQATIAAFAEAVSKRSANGSPPETVAADDVTIDSDGGTAQASGDHRGAMSVRYVDGKWLVDLPFFRD